MGKKTILLFLLFLNFLVALNGQRIKSYVSVNKLLPEQEAPVNSVVYYLPRTIVKVEVSVEQRVYRAGMFSAYSENLLNISPIVRTDSVCWNIVDIKISTIGEADKQKKYSIVASGDASAQFISLSEDGRLLGFNLPNCVEEKIAPDYEVKNDLVVDDVTFSAVPFLEKQLKTTSLPAMALSSAEMIYKLRKRQLKLIGFEYEHHPTDKDLMGYTLTELKRQEQLYEELFIGKSKSQIVVKTFLIDSDRLNNNIEALFNFSNTSGFVETENDNSSKYLFRTTRFDKISIAKSNEDKKSMSNTGVVYNLAESINFHLIKDSTELFVKKIQIASKESTADISPKILIQRDVTIELDEKTGALKSISKHFAK